MVWFLTIEEASSHLSGDDWPFTKSSLSMISPSSELSYKSDQLVPLSQRLMLHPVAFLQLLFGFFRNLIPICNQLFDVAFFLVKLLIFCHKRFDFALHSMKNAMINYFLYSSIYFDVCGTLQLTTNYVSCNLKKKLHYHLTWVARDPIGFFFQILNNYFISVIFLKI